MDEDFNKRKFSLREIFINEDGKTSCSGFIGGLAGMASILGFILSFIGAFTGVEESLDLLEGSIKFFMFAAGVLGVRKGTSAVFKRNNNMKG